MRNMIFVFAWTFVLMIAGYDAYFAWQYRAGFHAWELNPVARWLAQGYGLRFVLGLKIALLAFGISVAAYCHFRRHYLELPYTLIVSGIHVLLTLHYALARVLPG